jgi:hypothetical protein
MLYGFVAQLVEQWPFKPLVQGSNPCKPKIYEKKGEKYIIVEQVGVSRPGPGFSRKRDLQTQKILGRKAEVFLFCSYSL